jgi:hypothetical protein
MQILQARKAIVDRLARILDPVPVAVHPHASMDQRHLESILKNRYLGVYVAFRGNQQEDAAYNFPEVDAPFDWAVFICAKDGDKSGLRRDEQILSVLPAVLVAVAQSGELAQLSEELQIARPERIRSVPVFEGELEIGSTMLWAVTWRQGMSLGEKAAADDLRPYLTLVTRYDLAPKDGVIDATDVINVRTTP